MTKDRWLLRRVLGRILGDEWHRVVGDAFSRRNTSEPKLTAMCWYCYWGWSTPVAMLYKRYLPLVGFAAMHQGPGRLVWSDQRFDQVRIRQALAAIETDPHPHATDAQRAALRECLEALLAIPDTVRDPCPSAYWDEPEVPERYPPPPGLEMVRAD